MKAGLLRKLATMRGEIESDHALPADPIELPRKIANEPQTNYDDPVQHPHIRALVCRDSDISHPCERSRRGVERVRHLHTELIIAVQLLDVPMMEAGVHPVTGLQALDVRSRGDDSSNSAVAGRP